MREVGWWILVSWISAQSIRHLRFERIRTAVVFHKYTLCNFTIMVSNAPLNKHLTSNNYSSFNYQDQLTFIISDRKVQAFSSSFFFFILVSRSYYMCDTRLSKHIELLYSLKTNKYLLLNEAREGKKKF